MKHLCFFLKSLRLDPIFVLSRERNLFSPKILPPQVLCPEFMPKQSSVPPPINFAQNVSSPSKIKC